MFFKHSKKLNRRAVYRVTLRNEVAAIALAENRKERHVLIAWRTSVGTRVFASASLDLSRVFRLLRPLRNAIGCVRAGSRYHDF